MLAAWLAHPYCGDGVADLRMIFAGPQCIGESTCIAHVK